MREWAKAMAIWAFAVASTFLGVWIANYVWEWVIGNSSSPAKSAIALGALAFVALILIDSRNRMVNRNNRGRYDGGIDQHRPKGE